jgi:hypothetical protein
MRSVGVRAGDGGYVEVFAVNSVKMMSFAHALGVHLAVGIGDDLCDFLVEFDNGRAGSAVDSVDFAVVVEENRQVMHARELVSCPGTVGGLGAENLAADSVDIGKDVEHAVVVADAWRPNAPAVYGPAFKAEGGAEVEAIHAIAGKFPVHKVLRVQDDKSGIHVHGGAGEIVIRTDANDVGILEFLIEQGIGIGAIAVVGGPTPRRGSGSCGRVWRCSGVETHGQRDHAHKHQKKSKASHGNTPRTGFLLP